MQSNNDNTMNTCSKHLTFVFFQETGIDVPELMNPWTYQMGLPVITVSENGGQITLTPDRFLSDPEADPELPETEYKYFFVSLFFPILLTSNLC